MRCDTPLWALSAGELLAGYQGRAFSPIEVIDALARRIEQLSPSLGAFTTLCLDRARAEALIAERSLHRGDAVDGLTGVPFAVKDVFDTSDVRTTYGSRMYHHHVPESDASTVAAVRAAGGILIGKTQTHEFAWGITSVNEALGTAHNPWDVERISGGSSGGSAVALAARMVPLALGSDTGGSIRVPAAFCGVLGFKPTYGRFGRTGLWPLAPSLDHPGPMARTPGDLERLLLAMRPGGSHSRGPAQEAPPDLSGITIVICPDLHLAPLSADVERAFQTAVTLLGGLGATLEERRLPGAALILETFSVIQATEAVQVHRDAGLFPRRAEAYGRDVRARLEWGAALDPRRYVSAIADREQIRSDFGRLLSRGAFLITPVAAGPPVTIVSEMVGGETEGRFRQQVLPFTSPHDLIGLPTCAARCGFDDEGRPIGIQISAAPGRDREVLRLVQAFWEATPDIQAGWPDPASRRAVSI